MRASQVESSIGDRMHVLDTDMDGVVSKEEIDKAISFLKAQLCEYAACTTIYLVLPSTTQRNGMEWRFSDHSV